MELYPYRVRCAYCHNSSKEYLNVCFSNEKFENTREESGIITMKTRKKPNLENDTPIIWQDTAAN